jgi:hypothetical protein
MTVPPLLNTGNVRPRMKEVSGFYHTGFNILTRIMNINLLHFLHLLHQLI